ncbi:hypothetical protein MUP65_02940, partial [Patescibacteria group bacterium]|nr:hypothetical protein [Patescibacteria group bacterium]
RVQARFDFDNLTAYQVRHDQQEEGFVEVRALRPVEGEFGYVWKDQIFADRGGYYQANSFGEQYLVPTLFTDRAQEEIEFSLEETEKELVLKGGVVEEGEELVLPSLTADYLVPVRLWVTQGGGQTEVEIEYLRPEVRVEGQLVGTNPRESLFLATSQPMYLAVNKADFFLLTGARKNQLVGETYLKTEGVNRLNFYALESKGDLALESSQFTPAAICGPEVEGAEVVGMETETGELEVTAQLTANCMSAPLGFLSRKNSLFRIEYSYRSIEGGVPQYCLADTRYYTCFNRKNDNRLLASGGVVSVVELAEAEEFVENGLVLTLIAEALESETHQGVVYSDLKVAVHPLVGQGVIDLSGRSDLLGPKTVSIPVSGEAEVAVAKIKSRYNYLQPLELDLVGKESVTTPFLYQPQGQAYLFTVESSVGQRLPTRAWVENHHLQRGETDSYLLDSEEVAKNRILLPKMSNFYDGYYFHFDNPKHAGDEGVNRLESVGVRVWPYEYLKRLKVVSGFEEEEPGLPVKFTAKKQSYWRYEVEFETDQAIGENELLVFNQGYDRAWLAFADQPWRGERLVQVKVNNWANGWVLSDDLAGRKIYLVYWPQLLQYTGFIASGLVLGGIMIGGGMKRVWPKKKDRVKKEEEKTQKRKNRLQLKEKLASLRKQIGEKQTEAKPVLDQKKKLVQRFQAWREARREQQAEKEFELAQTKKIGLSHSGPRALRLHTHLV